MPVRKPLHSDRCEPVIELAARAEKSTPRWGPGHRDRQINGVKKVHLQKPMSFEIFFFKWADPQHDMLKFHAIAFVNALVLTLTIAPMISARVPTAMDRCHSGRFGCINCKKIGTKFVAY